MPICNQNDLEQNADLHIGQKIAYTRKARNMSQGELSLRIGVSYQQIQKYEKARNRISASRLYLICSVLDIDISDFFTDIKTKIFEAA
jgi:transcriptional regulator with XRE-family HTH domain